MSKQKRRISIKVYLYILLILTILFIAIGTLLISYHISVTRVNDYYDSMAKDNAYNISTYLDGDYIRDLRKHLETQEYQELRLVAEENDDQDMIKQDLIDNGLWDNYIKYQEIITKYLNNMSDIKYIYIIAHGAINANHDMYMIDDSSVEIYESGYYEQREKEFLGKDLTNLDKSVLNHSDYGWLYSNYAPIYDSNGDCVGIVGCDIDLETVIMDRRNILTFIIIWVAVLVIGSIIGILIIITKTIVRPLEQISTKIQEFAPMSGITLNDPSIMNLKFKRQNEISDIADNIRALEMDTVNFINNINNKDEQINALDMLSTKDSLTGVGNVRAYKTLIDKINSNIKTIEFAILMADINNLKTINDTYGHKEGDVYIQTCCKMLCSEFKHSAVFRIGGDEFVVIIQNEDFTNRFTLYEELENIYNNNFNNTSIPIKERYSMSLGLGEKQDSDITTDTIFKRADKAMYENKKKIKACR